MSEFEIASYPEGLAALLTDEPEMELGAGEPDRPLARRLEQLDWDAALAPRAIIDPTMAAACHSGLWLLHNFLDESHQISQDIDSSTGSFWHGIMHRREGDFGNAKYWFRRVTDHPVYAPLAAAAHQIDPRAFISATVWDPFGFVDLCEEAVRGPGADASVLRQVARREWELLFDFCFRHTVGED